MKLWVAPHKRSVSLSQALVMFQGKGRNGLPPPGMATLVAKRTLNRQHSQSPHHSGHEEQQGSWGVGRRVGPEDIKLQAHWEGEKDPLTK